MKSVKGFVKGEITDWNKGPKRKKAHSDYGPAMSQLTPLQQKFVESIVFDPFASKSLHLIRAGYKGKIESAAMMVKRLNRDPLVIAAREEVVRTRLMEMVPMAVQALENLVNNPTHRDHAKAVGSLLDRTGHSAVTKTEVQATVTHQFDRSQVIATIASIMERNQPALIVRPVITAVIEADD